MALNIVSWNVNGIRSLTKDVATILKELNADIACFQETKISKDQMTEKLAMIDGYRSYFSYCKTRAGYSGVVTYCKREIQALRVTDGITSLLEGEHLEPNSFGFSSDILKKLDQEGRAVITQHQLSEPINSKSVVSVINLYCPCVTGERDGREQFRLQYLQVLEERIQQLKQTSHVIVVGDMNIAHKIIDHCDPGDESEFLSEPHRLWFDKLVNTDKVVIDSYRQLNPTKRYAYTCWNTRTNARQTNFGTRIDYILVDSELRTQLSDANVYSKYMGSDHCPVGATLKLKLTPSSVIPTLCSSNRYKKRQQKLTMFVKKRESDNKSNVFDGISSSQSNAVQEKKPRMDVERSQTLGKVQSSKH